MRHHFITISLYRNKVIPAKAGIQKNFAWMPASAGMTISDIVSKELSRTICKVMWTGFLWCVIFSLQNLLWADEPLTLAQCYELALKRSETIAIQQELIKEAEGSFLQSLSGVFPDASFIYSDKRQDGSGSSNFKLSEIPESRFTVTQPLFSGFKEFAALAAGQAEKRQRIEEQKRARQLLFLDVADAFYLFLSYQEDADTLNSITSALTERIDELLKREELGRSRPSETANAQLRLSRIEAEKELIESQGEAAHQLLEFLTGQSIVTVMDSDSLGQPFLEQGEFLSKMPERPDVKAGREALFIAKKLITRAKGDFFPMVDLEGNYYTKRVGNSDDVDWDATLTIEMPVFNGGETFGKVKEAKAQAKQAELQLSAKERGASLEIQNAFTQWQSNLRRSVALEKAVAAAEKNYQLQKEDYQLNLVNNLTVLDALEDLQSTRREYIAVKNETKRSYCKLKVAAGETP